MAERMGFEPMVRSRESLVFKTSSINHSDTSPQWLPPNASIILAWKAGVVNPGFHFFLQFFSTLCSAAFLVRRRSQMAQANTAAQSHSPLRKNPVSSAQQAAPSWAVGSWPV